ncbi:hypothetical protein [Phaeobacter inhibens]|uniref:hypothetical protein n=1 Tax=Phaeobacter inhibens TaxID=221822 RepID=UPI00076BBD30|nr:hypothetical protein [Phaeobacter inhibens]WHP68843.1 hypothetical protein QMZ01_01250 [Phaeobacter inhibens]
MQARLPPIGDEARVAALCARCVFDDNRGLFTALITCTFSGRKTHTERDNMTVIRFVCATIVASFAAHANASEFCTPKAAFSVCHALHQDQQPDYLFYNDCVDIQKVACEATLDLSEKFFPSSTDDEKKALQKCATSPTGNLDWVHSYDCSIDVATTRNNRIYNSFLADRNLQDPGSQGAICTTLYIIADDVRRCLGDNKHMFTPIK